MRLIDADKLKETVEEFLPFCPTNPIDCENEVVILKIIDAILDSPTVDPKIYGYWTEVGCKIKGNFAEYEYECSRCEGRVDFTSPYCPYCGTKIEDVKFKNYNNGD